MIKFFSIFLLGLLLSTCSQNNKIEKRELSSTDKKSFNFDKKSIEELENLLSKEEIKNDSEEKKALDRSKKCGNLKCEPKIGENPLSCPLDCGRSPVQSFNYNTTCTKFKKIHHPKSEAELIELLKTLKKKKGLKIRFVGTKHSSSSIICSNEEIIFTRDINKEIKLIREGKEKFILAGSGAYVGEVSDFAHKNNLALGFAFPILRKVTLGGVVATGSHGSSRVHPAFAHQRVVEMTLIDLSGNKIVLSDEKNANTFKAAKVNLGAFGFISSFKIKTGPNFNLKVSFHSYDDSKMIDYENKRVNWRKRCDFEIITWFFGIGKVIKLCGNKTTEPADKSAQNVLLVTETKGTIGRIIKNVLHKSKKRKYYACGLSQLRYRLLTKRPPFEYEKESGKRIKTSPVVGPAHKMLHSRDISWDGQTFGNFDYSLAIPEKDMFKVMVRLKEFARSKDLCLPMTGITMRFGRSDGETLLGSAEQNSHTGGELFVLTDILDYKYFNIEEKYAKKFGKDANDLIKILISEFKAVPHWGKNIDWVFDEAVKAGVYNKGFLRQFESSRSRFDPNGVLVNPLLEKFQNL